MLLQSLCKEAVDVRGLTRMSGCLSRVIGKGEVVHGARDAEFTVAQVR
jgi:hypothetical protein